MSRYKYNIGADNLSSLANELDMKVYLVRRCYKEANSTKEFKTLLKKCKSNIPIGKLLESFATKYNIPICTIRTIYYTKCDKDMDNFNYELNIKVRYDTMRQEMKKWYFKYKNLTTRDVNRVIYTKFSYTKHDLIDEKKFNEVEQYIAERYI